MHVGWFFTRCQTMSCVFLYVSSFCPHHRPITWEQCPSHSRELGRGHKGSKRRDWHASLGRVDSKWQPEPVPLCNGYREITLLTPHAFKDQVLVRCVVESSPQCNKGRDAYLSLRVCGGCKLVAREASLCLTPPPPAHTPNHTPQTSQISSSATPAP